MKWISQWLIGAAVAVLLCGCATTRPTPLQDAIELERYHLRKESALIELDLENPRFRETHPEVQAKRRRLQEIALELEAIDRAATESGWK